MPKFIKIEESYTSNIRVYRLLKGRQKIHEDYGLWICNLCRGGGSKPYVEPMPRRFEFFCISHLFKGRGWFWTPENGKKFFDSGYAVIVPPGVVHDYGGDGALYEEDSVCFTGPAAENLLKAGILKTGVFRLGNVRKILKIMELASNPARDFQIQANLALQTLLVDLYLDNKKAETGSSRALIDDLMEELQADLKKSWTVEEMAAVCNLSVNQFIRVFRKHTGLTPKKYLDGLKVKIASELLKSSNEAVSQIAANLGFDDPFHFSRRFKEITGVSPQKFRNNSF
jgi:AraC-like DNA-binding protein